jgi:hypothetical protein
MHSIKKGTTTQNSAYLPYSAYALI